LNWLRCWISRREGKSEAKEVGKVVRIEVEIPIERIERPIFLIGGQKVMLERITMKNRGHIWGYSPTYFFRLNHLAEKSALA
jgi:hypothetical protein